MKSSTPGPIWREANQGLLHILLLLCLGLTTQLTGWSSWFDQLKMGKLSPGAIWSNVVSWCNNASSDIKPLWQTLHSNELLYYVQRPRKTWSTVVNSTAKSCQAKRCPGMPSILYHDWLLLEQRSKFITNRRQIGEGNLCFYRLFNHKIVSLVFNFFRVPKTPRALFSFQDARSMFHIISSLHEIRSVSKFNPSTPELYLDDSNPGITRKSSFIWRRDSMLCAPYFKSPETHVRKLGYSSRTK